MGRRGEDGGEEEERKRRGRGEEEDGVEKRMEMMIWCG